MPPTTLTAISREPETRDLVLRFDGPPGEVVIPDHLLTDLAGEALGSRRRDTLFAAVLLLGGPAAFLIGAVAVGVLFAVR